MKKEIILFSTLFLAFTCLQKAQAQDETTQSKESLSEYGLNFDKSLKVSNPTENKITSFCMASGKKTNELVIENTENNTVYRDLTPNEIRVKAGSTITPTISYTGNKSINAYLWIDLNQDGKFTTEIEENGTVTANSELLSYSFYNGKNSLGETTTEEAAGYALPKFTLPSSLSRGIYRARLMLDTNSIDPAGNWKEGSEGGIDANGGYIIDFLVNVYETYGQFEVNGIGGHLVGDKNTGIGTTVMINTSCRVLPLAPADGYKLDKIVVRHGYNLHLKSPYIHGNRQWSEYVSTDCQVGKTFVVPKDSVNGDVSITAYFSADGSETYKLIFADEFNTRDNSRPNSKYWNYGGRGTSTSDRFVAKTSKGKKETANIIDGKLVVKCLPNTFLGEGDVDMVSCAINSNGKVYFTYGRVEGRLRTVPHTGSFPAFWMMPQDNSAGWPNAGEIDIWEQIDTENISYHTVHTHATYDLHTALPNGGSRTTSAKEYHIMTLDWQPELLTWYVDGKKVFSYAKSKSSTMLEKGQWPFDKPFYFILNQSVGDGSWAKVYDPEFSYETYFDYVRVYQEEIQPSYIANNKRDTLDIYPRQGSILLVAPQPTAVNITDLQGRKIFSQTVQGNHSVNLTKGIYIVNGSKIAVQ